MPSPAHKLTREDHEHDCCRSLAPKAPFSVVLRLYWPKAEALEGKWIAPPLKRVE